MPKKNQIQQDQPQDGSQPADDQSNIVGLKGKPEDDSANKEARWQKVASVFDEAQKAYMEGAKFNDVIASLIETLQNIAESEAQQPMGGLGITGRPEMDLPQEPPAETPIEQ